MVDEETGEMGNDVDILTRRVVRYPGHNGTQCHGDNLVLRRKIGVS